MTASELLSDDWQQRLRHHPRWVVGLSGGLDSMVLVHALASLPYGRERLSVLHVHHGLSPHADAWQAHCVRVCEQLDVALQCHGIQLETSSNIESTARDKRYQLLAALLGPEDACLVAHHADDQAETMLLQLMRGTGVDGLAAMPFARSFGCGVLLRPLLMHTRQRLEAYAIEHALSWIEDESNTDTRFARNHVRHHVLPALRQRWPHAALQLTKTALHCQEAEKNLHALAQCDGLIRAPTLLLLPTLPQERLTNLVRGWLKENDVRVPSSVWMRHLMQEVVHAKTDATPSLCVGNRIIRRYRQTLYLCLPQASVLASCWFDFPNPLLLGQETLYARQAEKGVYVPPGSVLRVGFRQGGEVFFWRGKHHSLKKLLQAWGVPPWERATLPLVYLDECLVAVVGFATHETQGHVVGDVYQFHTETSYHDATIDSYHV